MGIAKSLQCRYHGWTYGLDGSLRACPEMEETEDFRKEDFGLVPVRVERARSCSSTWIHRRLRWPR